MTPPDEYVTRLQSPETATDVASVFGWRPPGSGRRLIRLPFSFATNASTLPFVSPPTRFVAAERKATQDGRLRKLPLTAAPKDGPLAWPPRRGRETRVVEPGNHWVPSLWNVPARRTTKTSLTPLVSPATRFVASDSNAITRAQRRSFEITALVDGPLGSPPPAALEMSTVFWTSARSDAAEAGCATLTAASASTGRRRSRFKVVARGREGGCP